MDDSMRAELKVQRILMQENRVATDLKNMDDNVVINEKLYNVEATKSENAFIDEVLNTDKYMGAIDQETRVYLENKYSRNASHILVNDHKWYGTDSGLMQNVKDSISALEKSLTDDEMTPETIADTRQKYKDAITACENYIAGKKPWFPSGKRRKKEVEERLKRLKEEQEQFEWGVSGVEKDLTDGTYPVQMSGYLTVGKKQMIRGEECGARYKKNFEEQFAEAHAVANMYIIKEEEKAKRKNTAKLDFDVRDKKLSEKAQAFFDEFFRSKDIAEAVLTNETTDRWSEFEGLKEKNTYMNQSVVLQVDKVYKMLNDDHDTYFANNAVLDKLYDRFEKEMHSIDTLSFTLQLLSDKKNGITDPEVKREVTDKIDYYYEIMQRVSASAQNHLHVIETIMEKKSLKPEDVEFTDMEDDLRIREKAGM